MGQDNLTKGHAMQNQLIFIVSLLLVLTIGCSEEETIVENNGEGALILSEVDPEGERVEIFNGSTEEIDLSTYWFCVNNGGGYLQLNDSTLSIESGSLTLGANEYIVFDLSAATNLAGKISDTDGADVGLYSEDSFTDASAIVDYVKFGDAAPAGRENIAVDAEIWGENETVDISNLDTGETVTRTNTIAYGESAWAIANNTLGASN